MRRARAFVWIFGATAVVPTVAVALLVYLADPYQHYRSADRYPGPMRFLAPGLALHQPYDGIVLGDSMSQNFLPAMTTSVLGRPFINLAISGATYFEEHTLLETALRSGHLREVLWGISYSEARGAPDRTRLDAKFPIYLYDDDPLNDVRYLFNRDVIPRALLRAAGRPIGKGNLNKINNWYRGPGNQPGRARVLARFHRTRQGTKPANRVPKAYRLAVISANFDANILGPVLAHPEVRFNVFIPPFTALKYVQIRHSQPALFATVVAYYRHVFHALAGLPNVRLYYFDDQDRVTHNLDLYKDPRHYQIWVNAWILKQVAADRYRVTPQDSDARLDGFVARVSGLTEEELVAPPGPRRP